MTDADLERRLHDLRLADLAIQATDRPVDTGNAWRDLQARRSKSRTGRRRVLAAAVATVAAAAAIAVPVLAGLRSASGPAKHPAGAGGQPSMRKYPGAVVARIPMSGVTAVVGDAGHAWVIRTVGQDGIDHGYQLAGIDLRTNAIMFRTPLGRQPRAIAMGDGRLWLTTASGRARGQVVRVDLATGQVLSTLHLPAGRCDFLAFSSGLLFAGCHLNDPGRSAFWRINPVTQRATRLAGTVDGYISSVIASPQAVWYVVNLIRVGGVINAGGNPKAVMVHDPGFENPTAGRGGLAYDDGALWALGASEKVARIDAATGRLIGYYTYRNYDPARAGGLDYLTASGGWLWFIDNGYPFSGVLRVSEATGQPAGGVPIPPNSCGQVSCSQIYVTPGSVWLPTAELLIRIDPSRLPG
jgi:hypothetical protein